MRRTWGSLITWTGSKYAREGQGQVLESCIVVMQDATPRSFHIVDARKRLTLLSELTTFGLIPSNIHKRFRSNIWYSSRLRYLTSLRICFALGVEYPNSQFDIVCCFSPTFLANWLSESPLRDRNSFKRSPNVHLIFGMTNLLITSHKVNANHFQPIIITVMIHTTPL